MYRISNEHSDLVADVVSQNLSPFREEILEKDLVISKVLELASTLDTDPIRLSFGGGTSLVKARGLMDRLSEDIDLKMTTPAGLSRSRRRSKMSQIRADFKTALEACGFVGIKVEAKYDGGFSLFLIPYRSRFESGLAFEGSITLEFFAQDYLAPTSPMPVRSLVYTLAGAPEPTQTLEIVALEETAAQKIIALLSRVRTIENQPKLVRHIYDLWRIRELGKNQDLMQTIFDFSIIELSQRSKSFSDPATEFQVLQLALHELKSSPKVKIAFNRQLAAMASKPPSFEEAVSVFTSVASTLFSGSKFERHAQ